MNQGSEGAGSEMNGANTQAEGYSIHYIALSGSIWPTTYRMDHQMFSVI